MRYRARLLADHRVRVSGDPGPRCRSRRPCALQRTDESRSERGAIAGDAPAQPGVRGEESRARFCRPCGTERPPSLECDPRRRSHEPRHRVDSRRFRLVPHGARKRAVRLGGDRPRGHGILGERPRGPGHPGLHAVLGLFEPGIRAGERPTRLRGVFSRLRPRERESIPRPRAALAVLERAQPRAVLEGDPGTVPAIDPRGRREGGERRRPRGEGRLPVSRTSGAGARGFRRR